MAKEQEDLNKSQSVADPDLSQPVTGTDLTAPGQSEPVKLADGTDETKTVPYSELKKAVDDRKAAEEREQALQNQIALINANANQQAQQPRQQTQPVSIYDQAKADLGLTGEEYIDEGQKGKIFARMNEITQQQNQQNAAMLSNQQFESSHSDFGSVVGLRNPLTGVVQPTAEILKILTEKPYLTAAAYASSQGAYEIVMEQRKLDELQLQNTVQEEHLKQQGIDTKLAPVSGAAAAGGAVTTTGASVTAQQQQEMEERVASGEFNVKKG